MEANLRPLRYFVVPILLSLSACSQPPTAGEAETYWRDLISNSNGLIRLVSFAKTDGKSTPNGYTLYYSVTYEFSSDCQYDSTFHAKSGLPKGLDFFGAMGTGQAIGKKGQQMVQSGEMWYEKRESGWRLVNVQNNHLSESESSQQRRTIEDERRRQAVEKEKANPPAQYFNDFAGVIRRETQSRLNSELKQFESDTSDRIVVAIYPEMASALSIEKYAAQLAPTWRIGEGMAENGAILFVFIKERKIYLYVTEDLSAVIPDNLATDIIDNHIKPWFARGDFEGGSGAGLEAILARIRASGISH